MLKAKLFLLVLLLPGLVTAQTASYSYDQAGRLTAVDYGAEGKITYSYDNNGNRLQRVVSSGGAQVPNKPAGVNATNGAFSDRVRVTFNIVAGATVYRLHRCLTAGQTCGSPIGFPKTGTFDDKKAVPGTLYFYRVRACNASGCSNFSAANTGFASVAPARPTSVRATDGAFPDRVRVTFNTVADATLYRVFRCLTPGQTCGTPIGFPKTGTFDDRNGVPGTVYFYRVRACTTTTCGKFSAANTGFSSTAPVVPGRPTSVKATDGTFADKVRVTFNTVAGATVYRVFRCLTTGQTCGTPVGFTNTGTFDDKKGVSGTIYFYRVRACTTTTCGLFSAANTGHRGSIPSTDADLVINTTEAVRIPALGLFGLILLSLGVILLALVAKRFGKVGSVGSLMLVLLCTPAVLHADNPGLAGHAIGPLAINPQAPSRLYAGLANGVVGRSIDGGANWILVDTTVITESVTALAVDPENPSIVYAAGGSVVAKSMNSGVSWQNARDPGGGGAFGQGFSAMGIFTLAVDPLTPSTIYAGTRATSNSGEVYKSLNGGLDWALSLFGVGSLAEVAIDPVTPSTLYASSFDTRARKSTNGGGSWSTTGAIPAVFYSALAIDPEVPSTLYIGMTDGGSGGIYKSTNGGVSWSSAKSGLSAFTAFNSIVINPADTLILYTANSGSSGSVWKSSNAGGSWVRVDTGLSSRRTRDLVIDPDTPSSIYAATDNGIYKSEDSGDIWVTPPPPIESNDPSNASNAGCTLCSDAGEPVNTFSGELYEPLPADISLGGPLPLVFERYYAAFLRRSFIVGDLGSNWRHNFDGRLFISGNTAKYVSFKGRVTDFLKNLNTAKWEQQTNLDTTYQLVKPDAQDAVLFDPQANLIFSFDFTSDNIIIGKLVSIADGKGNVHTVTYDPANGQIKMVSDGMGRTLTFTYNTDAIPKISLVSGGTRSVVFQYTDPVDSEYLTTVTDVRGGLTTYAYKDTSTNADQALMLHWTLPRGNIPYQQTFDALGRVSVQTDASGNTLGFAYDTPAIGQTTLTGATGVTRIHSTLPSGAFSGMKDQAGRSFAMATDAKGRRKSMTDRLGSKTSLGYHAASGKLAAVTNADASTQAFSYTPRTVAGLTFHDLTGITNPDGTTETLARDGSGNLTSHTDQRGNSQSYTYNGSGQVLTATNKISGVTRNAYNANGTLGRSTDPAGNVTRFAYDSLKRPRLITKADGSTRSLAYDAADYPLTTVDENGNSTTMTWDANGNLASLRDALLNTTTYSYDGNDRLLSVQDALGGVSSVTYHPLGGPGTRTDANGNVISTAYNSLGRPIAITDALGNTWPRSYDAEAIIKSSADPLGNTTTFVSDTMGRITQTTSPLGNINSVSFDPMGRKTSATNALNQVTTMSRDARGHLSGIALPGGAVTVAYTRNALGEVTSATDANGNVWNWTYDSGGRLTSLVDPLGRANMVSYDNRNLPSKIVLPATVGTQTLAYDAAGNLTASSYTDGTTLGFTYDARNRMTSANNGSGTANNMTRVFDANGEIKNSNGIVITRDAGGRVLTMRLAAGKTITYTYDGNNRVNSVTDWLGGITSFSYDRAGRLTGVTRPNGVDQTNTWDKDSRLVGITEGSISSIALSRDAAGQITAATRTVPTPVSLSALTSTAHSYDAASQMNGRTYDALGRQTSAGADSFTWDAGSRLTRYTVDGVTVVNVYDALGRRIRRTSAGISSAYVWNDALGLASISVERRAGVVFRFFIHTPEGELLYTIDAATNARRYYHYEETGNTIFVTNQAGNVIASYAYTPFGQLTASTGTLDNPFTWQGERGVMTEPGDHYYVRSRYYDGADGRFLSRDPIGAMGPKTINPYQYALANPLLFVDPSGGVSIRLQLEVTNTRRMVLVARQRLKRTRAKADQAAHVARVAQAYLSPKVAQPAVDHAALLARFVQEDLRTLAARLRARDAAERASRMALNAERANKKSSGVQLQTHIPDVFSSGFYEIAGLPLISLEMEQTLLKKLNRSKKESNIKHLREILDAARRQAETGGTRTRSQQDALNKDVRNAEAAFEAAGGIISVVPELVPIVVLN